MANNYVIPRGTMYFQPVGESGERYFGNTPQATLNVASESLEHTNELGEVDEDFPTKITRTLNFTADDISDENLALFIGGASASIAQAATPVVDEAIAAVQQGRWYTLGVTTANPTGVRDVGSVVVTDDVPNPAFVVDTDYTLDAATGRIYIVEGGGIANGTNLLVDYTPVANTRQQVSSSSSISVEGAMRIVADNNKGENRDYFMPKVTLKPSGDLPLKATDAAWQEIAFEAAVQAPANQSALYIDGRPA